MFITIPNLVTLTQTVLEIYELLSSNFSLVTDGQTNRRKVTHKSPPCISTGGLKKRGSSFCTMEYNAGQWSRTNDH